MKTIKLTLQLIPVAIFLTAVAIIIYNAATYGISLPHDLFDYSI